MDPNTLLMQQIHRQEDREPGQQDRRISGAQPKVRHSGQREAAEHLPDDAEPAVQPAGIEKDPGKIDRRQRDRPGKQPGQVPPMYQPPAYAYPTRKPEPAKSSVGGSEKADVFDAQSDKAPDAPA